MGQYGIKGGLGLVEARTWYLVRSVLHTPVRSIIPTRNGTAALFAMMMDYAAAVILGTVKEEKRGVVDGILIACPRRGSTTVTLTTGCGDQRVESEARCGVAGNSIRLSNADCL